MQSSVALAAELDGSDAVGGAGGVSGESPQRPVVSVRAFARDDAGRILLLRRQADSAYGGGQWCLPGGKIDYGDSPESTVAKELFEETGLEARDITFLFYQDSPPLAPGKMHVINLYFRCAVEGALRLNQDESSAHVWLSLDEALALQPVFGAQAAIRRLLETGI